MINIKNAYQYREYIIKKFALYAENKDTYITNILFKLKDTKEDKEFFMDVIYDHINTLMIANVFEGLQYSYIADYKNGYAVVCKTNINTNSDLFGFINKKGEEIVEPKFDFAFSFKENGLAIVKKEGKFGFLKNSGHMLIEPIYDEVKNFIGDQAEVKIGNTWKFINKRGHYV